VRVLLDVQRKKDDLARPSTPIIRIKPKKRKKKIGAEREDHQLHAETPCKIHCRRLKKSFSSKKSTSVLESEELPRRKRLL